MGSKHNIPAVVTSLNINGLAVVRTLGRPGVPVIGIHNNDSDPEAKSRFLTKTWLSDPADLIQTLLKRAGDLAGPKPVLVPITDDAVTAIAQNLTALRELYTVPMPDPELVLQLLDKRGFDRIAQEMGLPVPQTWYVRSRDEMNAVGPDITFPCILKPQEKTPAYFAAGGLKAYVFEDLGALLSTYESFCAAEPRVVVQQYIPGGDDEVHFCLQACSLINIGEKASACKPES